MELTHSVDGVEVVLQAGLGTVLASAVVVEGVLWSGTG